MKRILFTVLIANTLIILGLSSCKKDALSPALNDSPGTQSRPPFVINLVADQWVNYGNEIYINNFPGILTMANVTGSPNINVYLKANGKKVQINNAKITFMGNDLWATATQTDIRINYKCSASNLPFTSLSFIVVIL